MTEQPINTEWHFYKLAPLMCSFQLNTYQASQDIFQFVHRDWISADCSSVTNKSFTSHCFSGVTVSSPL